MVDFNKVAFEDLNIGDQFRVKIGGVIAEAMQAAMMLVQSGVLDELDPHKRAQILTSVTVPCVYKIEGVITEFAERKGGCE